MLFLMFWLTFPTGLLFIVAAGLVLNPGPVHSPGDFITAWMVMACGGFLQWFVFVPRLFEKPNLTVLNLETPVHGFDAIPPKISSEPVAPNVALKKTALDLSMTLLNLEASTPVRGSEAIPTNISPEVVRPNTILKPTTLELPSPVSASALGADLKKTKIRRKADRSIKSFDRKGRTPLERVIERS